MAEVEALPAASVLVLRDAPLEVLLLRRHERSSFVPGAWVFPGGMVEPIDEELARERADGSTLAAMRFAGARETFEEAGIWLGAPLADAETKRRRLLGGEVSFRELLDEAPLDLEQLVWTSRWITPVGLPKRFDTWFFAVKSGRDVVATAEEVEMVDVAWVAPAEALERSRRREMQMVFPTLRNLEAVAAFEDVDALLDARRGANIEPVLPVLVNGKPTLP